MSRKLTLILDPAHGRDVAGKCSPDKSHYEWEWSRKILNELNQRLVSEGFKTYYTNTSDIEIGLLNRVDNANKCPGKYKLLFSLHNNAAGNGNRWRDATGFEIYTSRGKTKSDTIADIIMSHLKNDFKVVTSLRARVDLSDGDMDKEENFTVLMGNSYSAVLLEWLFQDNYRDLEWLKDPSMNSRLVDSLVRAFIEIDTKISDIK